MQQWLDHPEVGPTLLEGILQGASEAQRADMESDLDALRVLSSMPMRSSHRCRSSASPSTPCSS